MGRELNPGDVVHLLNKWDVFWTVQAVTPVMDPNAPAGLVQLLLAASFAPNIQGGQRVGDVLKILDHSEIQQPGPGPAAPQAEQEGDPPRAEKEGDAPLEVPQVGEDGEPAGPKLVVD